MRRTPIRMLAIVLALVGVAAACSGDSDDDVASSGSPAPVDGSEDEAGDEDDQDDQDDGAADDNAAGYPVTIESGGIETVIETQPEAIVSLSPTATEMIFAVGAGDLVVAADSFSNYPPEAPTTDLGAFDPNVEAILDYEPDLVVLGHDQNDVVSSLAAVDVPVLFLPAAVTLQDAYDQIGWVGSATGHDDEAARVLEQMQADIEELVASVPERDEPLTYYHELGTDLYSVTSSTFVGEIYGLAGLENVADAADPDGESSGYPQLSPEFLVEADPDLVFLADTVCCGQDLETFAARPGFEQMSAVRTGSVIPLDDDIASRWGPRVVDFLRAVVDAVQALDETLDEAA